MDIDSEKKYLRVKSFIILNPGKVRCFTYKDEIYKEIAKHGNRNIWYKVVFKTPIGILKCDTCGTGVIRASDAKHLLKDMREVPLKKVIENWDSNKLWDCRIVEKEFIEALS